MTNFEGLENQTPYVLIKEVTHCIGIQSSEHRTTKDDEREEHMLSKTSTLVIQG